MATVKLGGVKQVTDEVPSRLSSTAHPAPLTAAAALILMTSPQEGVNTGSNCSRKFDADCRGKAPIKICVKQVTD